MFCYVSHLVFQTRSKTQRKYLKFQPIRSKIIHFEISNTCKMKVLNNDKDHPSNILQNNLFNLLVDSEEKLKCDNVTDTDNHNSNNNENRQR